MTCGFTLIKVCVLLIVASSCEKNHPDLGEVEPREFTAAIKKQCPAKLLAYNCSPSFNCACKLSKSELPICPKKLAELGYIFQFTTVAGFYTLNTSMFELAEL